MPESEINPYAAPSLDPRTDFFTEELKFDGVITKEDYEKLFPVKRLENWSLWFLAVFSFSVLGVMAAGLIFAFRAGNLPPVAIVTIYVGLCCIFIGAFYFLLSRRRRGARNSLKSFSDLLGPAQGLLNRDGMFLNDGKRMHWFSPRQIVFSHATTYGVRIQIDKHQGRFLAFRDRLFESYSFSSIRSLIDRWKETGDDYNVENRYLPWQFEDDKKDEVIEFFGHLQIDQPLRTPEMRKSAIIETIGALVSLVISTMLFSGLLIAIGSLALVFSVVLLISSVRLWRKYFFGTTKVVWNQMGWISENEFVWRNDVKGIKRSLSELDRAIRNESLLTLVFNDGASLYLAEPHFHITDKWENTCKRLTELNGGE